MNKNKETYLVQIAMAELGDKELPKSIIILLLSNWCADMGKGAEGLGIEHFQQVEEKYVVFYTSKIKWLLWNSNYNKSFLDPC